MVTKEIVYAEDVPYWKTSQSGSDAWIDKAVQEIHSVKGKILARAFASGQEGKAAFMLSFALEDNQFKIVWPVLPSKTKNEYAARVQSATALYHDVKARVVSAKFLGVQPAFFCYLMLPNGQTASEATAAVFLDNVPLLLGGGS